jgi:subtilisin family serine protease
VLIVVDPDPLSLQLASRSGFMVIGDTSEPTLGLRSVEVAVPRGMSARSALRLIRRTAPQLQVDFDHVYEPAGGALLPVNAALASAAGIANGRVVGMIDGGVASHPSLAGARIEQHGFAGSPKPTGHGTAVASLLVGNQGPFRGAATGAQLYVADVYGGDRAAGSATAIVRALGWLASHRPQVINISLVGPPNKLIQRAIEIVRSRGIEVVAAVGNDGPAAPPQYPASYPGVVAISAVDAHGRALPEAGKATHLDFAAPGADMAAAVPGQGYARVRGTSFAAPLAAARLLLAGSPARLAAEARPGKGRVGHGIVCGDCRIDPREVGAR